MTLGTALMTPAASHSNWTLYRNRKPKGVYYRACIGVGAERRFVSLGYVTEEEAEAALVRLRAVGTRIFDVPAGRGFDGSAGIEGDPGPDIDPGAPPEVPVLGTMSPDAIREWALSDVVDACAADLGARQRRIVEELIRRGDYARLPLREYVEHVWRPVRASEAAPGTIEREQHLWKPILQALGDVPLQNLDTVKWDAFMRTLSDKAGRTRVLTQNAYRVALNYAFEVGILKQVHSFRKIRGATVRATPAPAALTLAEVDKLLAVAPSAVHRAMWVVGFSTGMRPGELSAMRWEDVDIGKATVAVRGTKTALSAATIPLPPAAVDAIRTHHEASGRPEIGPCWVYKQRVIAHYRSAIRTAARKAGLDGKVTPNSLRHSFATMAAMSGVPRAAARAMMRHSQRSEMLERAYEHPRQEQVADAMAAFPRVGKAR